MFIDNFFSYFSFCCPVDRTDAVTSHEEIIIDQSSQNDFQEEVPQAEALPEAPVAEPVEVEKRPRKKRDRGPAPLSICKDNYQSHNCAGSENMIRA